MKYEVTTICECETEADARKALESLGLVVTEVKKARSRRTINQNSSLHLYLTEWANELNEHGIDMKLVVREDLPIPCTMQLLKDNVWRKIQIALFGKHSTTELEKTEEIDKIVDVITKTFGERYGLYVAWPSFESLIDESSVEARNQF